MNLAVQFDLLTAIAQRVPGITLANALGLIEDFQRFPDTNTLDLTTHAGLVAFARSRPDVVDNLPLRKITAIKNLRNAAQAITGSTADGLPLVGLKQAKDAIDAIVASLPSPAPAPDRCDCEDCSPTYYRDYSVDYTEDAPF